MVDAADLGSAGVIPRGGSSPPSRTKRKNMNLTKENLSSFLVLLFLCFLPLSLKAQTEETKVPSPVTRVDIYQNAVFIYETFRVHPGENDLCLSAVSNSWNLTPKGLSFSLTKDFQVVEFNLYQKEEKEGIFEKIKELEEKIRDLGNQRDILLKETETIENFIKNGLKLSEIPSWQTFNQYLSSYREKLSRINEIDKLIQDLKKKLQELRSMLAGKKYTCLRIVLATQDVSSKKEFPEGYLTVRYLAPNIVDYRFVNEYYLDTQTKKVSLLRKLYLKQKTGKDWRDVTVNFYPQRMSFRIAPNPFHPQYIDEAWTTKSFSKSLELRKLPKMKASTLAGERAQSLQVKEVKEAIFDYVHIEHVNAAPGKETLIGLPTKDIQVEKLIVEVPLYDTPQAFFKVRIKPKFTLPYGRARFFVDGTYIGEWSSPKATPNEAINIYFGKAHGIKVERKIIKDTIGKGIIKRWRIYEEKAFRTKISNYYDFPVDLMVVDWVPLAHHKEIKIEPYAKPIWSSKDEQGKIIWKKKLKHGESFEIEFGYKISRPAKIK